MLRVILPFTLSLNLYASNIESYYECMSHDRTLSFEVIITKASGSIIKKVYLTREVENEKGLSLYDYALEGVMLTQDLIVISFEGKKAVFILDGQKEGWTLKASGQPAQELAVGNSDLRCTKQPELE